MADEIGFQVSMGAGKPPATQPVSASTPMPMEIYTGGLVVGNTNPLRMNATLVDAVGTPLDLSANSPVTPATPFVHGTLPSAASTLIAAIAAEWDDVNPTGASDELLNMLRMSGSRALLVSQLPNNAFALTRTGFSQAFTTGAGTRTTVTGFDYSDVLIKRVYRGHITADADAVVRVSSGAVGTTTLLAGTLVDWLTLKAGVPFRLEYATEANWVFDGLSFESSVATTLRGRLDHTRLSF